MPVTTRQLLELVQDEQSQQDLRTYFGCGLPPGELPPFTGGRFEEVGGGGDRPELANVITADDLLAVQLLSVRVPAVMALDLLEGPLGREVSALLASLEHDVELGTTDALAALAAGQPADQLWRLLDDQDDMGWVTAGKLLARKRPKLIPVYDRVVRCALGTRGQPSFWLWLNERFTDTDGVLPQSLKAARTLAGVADSVSAARVLDVVVWMRHRAGHRETRCPREHLPAL